MPSDLIGAPQPMPAVREPIPAPPVAQPPLEAPKLSPPTPAPPSPSPSDVEPQIQPVEPPRPERKPAALEAPAGQTTAEPDSPALEHAPPVMEPQAPSGKSGASKLSVTGKDKTASAASKNAQAGVHSVVASSRHAKKSAAKPTRPVASPSPAAEANQDQTTLKILSPVLDGSDGSSAKSREKAAGNADEKEGRREPAAAPKPAAGWKPASDSANRAASTAEKIVLVLREVEPDALPSPEP
jgi:hypothetical protein